MFWFMHVSPQVSAAQKCRPLPSADKLVCMMLYFSLSEGYDNSTTISVVICRDNAQGLLYHVWKSRYHYKHFGTRSSNG